MLAHLIGNGLIDAAVETGRLEMRQQHDTQHDVCPCPWRTIRLIDRTIHVAVGPRSRSCGCLEQTEHHDWMERLAMLLPPYARGAILADPEATLAALHEFAILEPPYVMTMQHALTGWYTQRALIATMAAGCQDANRCADAECVPRCRCAIEWGRGPTWTLLEIGRVAVQEKAKFILGRRSLIEPWFHAYYRRFGGGDDEEEEGPSTSGSQGAPGQPITVARPRDQGRVHDRQGGTTHDTAPAGGSTQACRTAPARSTGTTTRRRGLQGGAAGDDYRGNYIGLRFRKMCIVPTRVRQGTIVDVGPYDTDSFLVEWNDDTRTAAVRAQAPVRTDLLRTHRRDEEEELQRPHEWQFIDKPPPRMRRPDGTIVEGGVCTRCYLPSHEIVCPGCGRGSDRGPRTRRTNTTPPGPGTDVPKEGEAESHDGAENTGHPHARPPRMHALHSAAITTVAAMVGHKRRWNAAIVFGMHALIATTAVHAMPPHKDNRRGTHGDDEEGTDDDESERRPERPSERLQPSLLPLAIAALAHPA